MVPHRELYSVLCEETQKGRGVHTQPTHFAVQYNKPNSAKQLWPKIIKKKIETHTQDEMTSLVNSIKHLEKS